jgi:MoaA/NifB/PqqE/SkfB family radical SAM enzyme
MIISQLRNNVAVMLAKKPELKKSASSLYNEFLIIRNSLAKALPFLIRPSKTVIHFALTANCNQKCKGCRYGRDFMTGSSLSYEIVANAIEDANKAGFYRFRFYGGEPLLHPEINKIVSLCSKMGLNFCVVTNAVTLKERIDQLYKSGLRDIAIGVYGIGKEYDKYVCIPGNFEKVEKSIATVRKRYNETVRLQMNWLLRRSTCTPKSFQQAWNFAKRYQMKMQIDLLHYSVPYFQEGPDRILQFRKEDKDNIRFLIDYILKHKKEEPEAFVQSEQLIRSIPDWILKRAEMRIPCTAYQMLWIAPDGSVMLCHVTFLLGNLHDQPLRNILRSRNYYQAARNGFKLKCPNCYCNSNDRIMRHRASLKKYS